MKKFFFGVLAAVIVFLVLFFAVIKQQFFAVMLGPVVQRVELVSAVKPEVVKVHGSDNVGIVEDAVVSNVQVVERV